MRSRYGRLIVLALLLALGMLIAAWHNRSTEAGGSSVVATTVRAVLSPFQSAVHAIGRTGHNIRTALRPSRNVIGENHTLRAEVKQLSRENARLREEHAENIRLRELLKLKPRYSMEPLMAQVIAVGASQWHNTCTIDRGWRDGVRKTSTVVTPRGVVGQVIDVGASVSQALLLTDESSGVGAIVQRSRVTGICQGQQTGNLVMNYVKKDADVKTGDMVVTSGMGQVYPKGLLIGRVIKVSTCDPMEQRDEELLQKSSTSEGLRALLEAEFLRGYHKRRASPDGYDAQADLVERIIGAVKHKAEVGDENWCMKSADIRPSVQFDQLEEVAVIVRKAEQ